MKNPSQEVDRYIEKSPEFSKPILLKIRKAAHLACPDLSEVIKWRIPHFEKGGLVAAMSAYKKHVRLSFWKGTHLKDPEGILDANGNTGMSSMHLETLKEVPTQKVLVAYFKEALALNADGVKQATKSERRKPLPMPKELRAALNANPAAAEHFASFSPSNRRDYIEWVIEAKREATKEKRIAQAVLWIGEGKPRNWKYKKS